MAQTLFDRALFQQNKSINQRLFSEKKKSISLKKIKSVEIDRILLYQKWPSKLLKCGEKISVHFVYFALKQF